MRERRRDKRLARQGKITGNEADMRLPNEYLLMFHTS